LERTKLGGEMPKRLIYGVYPAGDRSDRNRTR